jgi:hypothetical protein
VNALEFKNVTREQILRVKRDSETQFPPEVDF